MNADLAGDTPEIGESGAVLALKRRIRAKQAVPNGVSDDQQIAELKASLAELIKRRNAEPEPAARDTKNHRFGSRGGPPMRERQTPRDGEGGASTSDAGSVPDSLAPGRSRGRVPGLFYWILTLVLSVGAFAAGRWMNRAPAVPEVKPIVAEPPALAWSEASLAQLDAALAAENGGDLEKATQLGMDLRNQAGALPGLDAYVGVLTARLHRINDAQAALSRLPPTAAIDNAIGFTYARQRLFGHASEAFHRAALAEPLAPNNFRLWGESLRREGQLGNAVKALQEALARYPSRAVEFLDARAIVALKIRLAQIEGGLEERQAARGRVAADDGYGWLTEAARALQRGDWATAAAALPRAKAALGSGRFDLLLGDYFFRAYASRPELAVFFPPGAEAAKADLASQQVYFIDP